MAVASSWQPRSLLPRRASHEGMNVLQTVATDTWRNVFILYRSMFFKGPVHVTLPPDRPLPVSAVVTGIEVPIRTQALRATVKLSDGAVQAQVSGRVDAPLDGEVTTQITKLIRHERIPVGL